MRSGSTSSKIAWYFVAETLGGEAETFALEHEALDDGAQVLPTNGRPEDFTGLSVPHNGRCALVGDADCCDRTGDLEDCSSGLQRRSGDTSSIDLYETRSGARWEDGHLVGVGNGPVRVDE